MNRERCTVRCIGGAVHGPIADVADATSTCREYWWHGAMMRELQNTKIVRQVSSGVQHLINIDQGSTHAIASQFGAFVGAQFAIIVAIVYGP